MRYHVEYRTPGNDWTRWTRNPFRDADRAYQKAAWCRLHLAHMQAEWRVVHADTATIRRDISDRSLEILEAAEAQGITLDQILSEWHQDCCAALFMTEEEEEQQVLGGRGERGPSPY